MEEKMEQSAECLGPQLVSDTTGQDRTISRRRLQRVRSRFQTTTSVVVLAGLAVMVAAITDIILQLVVWVVLT